jgi:hypothetical protein
MWIGITSGVLCILLSIIASTSHSEPPNIVNTYADSTVLLKLSIWASTAEPHKSRQGQDLSFLSAVTS